MARRDFLCVTRNKNKLQKFWISHNNWLSEESYLGTVMQCVAISMRHAVIYLIQLLYGYWWSNFVLILAVTGHSDLLRKVPGQCFRLLQICWFTGLLSILTSQKSFHGNTFGCFMWTKPHKDSFTRWVNGPDDHERSFLSKYIWDKHIEVLCWPNVKYV